MPRRESPTKRQIEEAYDSLARLLLEQFREYEITKLQGKSENALP